MLSIWWWLEVDVCVWCFDAMYSWNAPLLGGFPVYSHLLT